MEIGSGLACDGRVSFEVVGRSNVVWSGGGLLIYGIWAWRYSVC